MADGTKPETTSTPICGYNKNALSYCPWQLGDAPLNAFLPALTAYYKAAYNQCNPQTVPGRCNPVYTNKIPGL